MSGFRYYPEALAELDRAAEWYDAQQPGLATRFLGEVDRAIERIVQNPLTLPIKEGDVRSLAVKRFRYVILFRIEDEIVHVVAVMHTSRRPGYWRDRLN